MYVVCRFVEIDDIFLEYLDYMPTTYYVTYNYVCMLSLVPSSLFRRHTCIYLIDIADYYRQSIVLFYKREVFSHRRD